MRIFDNHFHIDKGLDGYGLPDSRRNVIFNSVHQYRQLIQTVADTDTATLIMDYRQHPEFVSSEAKSGNIRAFKLHTRIQQIASGDYHEVFDYFQTLEHLKLPVILDAFYTGPEMQFQPNLKSFAEMIQMFPHTPFIIAHSGGIKALEYLMHLRNVPNVYFDLSFSLVYLQHSSAYSDFKSIVRFGNPDRILFGTDYPFISAVEQLDVFLKIAAETGINEDIQDRILYRNAEKLFLPEPAEK